MKLLTMLLMLTLTPLWATAAPFTPEQEARIKQMIRETLVSNPDILAQAADAWQQQTDQQQGQARNQIIKQQHKILFEDPNSPRMGAEKPALTMVLFTDYNCPYCKRFDPLLEKIIKEYPQVALVVKFLPFKGESSVSSARIALTTWKQHPEQFWVLHQRLMAKKGFHDDASIAAAEQKTGVKHVAPNEESTGELAINMQLAQQLGIQGTPATLIGDELVPGAISYEQLEEVIKEQLAKVKK